MNHATKFGHGGNVVGNEKIFVTKLNIDRNSSVEKHGGVRNMKTRSIGVDDDPQLSPTIINDSERTICHFQLGREKREGTLHLKEKRAR